MSPSVNGHHLASTAIASSCYGALARLLRSWLVTNPQLFWYGSYQRSPVEFTAVDRAGAMPR